MNATTECVTIRSLGENLAGVLLLPAVRHPVAAMVICHGAADFKEHYLPLGEALASEGTACLALDMHGHGGSGGERFAVRMREWVADVRAAVDYLTGRPEVDPRRIGAFGLSSGGTAILEAALVDPRLKALVTAAPTVRTIVPPSSAIVLRVLMGLARIKRWLTGRDLRVPLLKLVGEVRLAEDVEVNRQLYADPRIQEAVTGFPLAGAAESLFTRTLRRVRGIRVPTLVLWGAEDQVDSPESGRLLYRELECRRELQVVPDTGHASHLDRNRAQVFALTARWVREHLGDGSLEATPASGAAVGARPADGRAVPGGNGLPRTIIGAEARALTLPDKAALLLPSLRQHGREAISYATMQEGMEYFVDECGYIAFVTAEHPVLARRPRRIVLCDPVCARADYPRIIGRFLADNPRALFTVISEECAAVLRTMGFKANSIGYETELPIQTYNTKGDWKELDLIRRARNEARREGITIREELAVENIDRAQFDAVTASWIASKKVNDREIWLFARKPVYGPEPDVRKFVAFDRSGRVAGFAFYDPIYRDGRVVGYSGNTSRCDEQRYARLTTAVHMVAIEQFKTEGKEVLNLCLAPFCKLELGRFNDDPFMKGFFQLSARYGNDIYNFSGLAFHRSKYRGTEKAIYYASNNPLAGNDLYLAFRAANISQSYPGMVLQLVRGMARAWLRRPAQGSPPRPGAADNPGSPCSTPPQTPP